MAGAALRWHATPGEMVKALRSAARGSVERVHTFLIPPGMLGGLYCASFAEGAGVVHRFLLSYAQPALLAWDLKPLRETLDILRIPETDGRVELGQNTGEILCYFLPSVGEQDSSAAEEARRQKSYEEWLHAACRGRENAAVVALPVPAASRPVVCLTRERLHFLFQLDGLGSRTLEAVRLALGAKSVHQLPLDTPLCRDIMGAWQNT